MTKSEALKIVRVIVRAYEDGESDATLAWRLQMAVKEMKEKRALEWNARTSRARK